MDVAMEYENVGSVLFVFLVLSVVFEAAINPIFNWSGYQKFHGRGFKTPLMIGLSFLVFWHFDLDIIRDLLVSMAQIEKAAQPTFMGQVLTAFLISGGNDAVRQIYLKLGIRMPKQNQTQPPTVHNTNTNPPAATTTMA
jgi:hypothetical protein